MKMQRYFLSRASFSITTHMLLGYSRALIPCSACLCEGNLRIIVSISISSFSENDTDFVNNRKRRGVISKLPAYMIAKRALAHATYLTKFC